MDKDRSQKFMLKMVGDVATALAGALVFVGDEAGLFRAMAGAGPIGAAQLSAATGVHLRYIEEWLAAMVGAGYVEFDAAADTYLLPDEHAVFLTDRSSEYYLGGLFRGLPGLMAVAPKLADAFGRGGGVSFADYGEHLPVALEQMNRAVYENRLVKTWLPTLPDVVARLTAGGRALDIGCGTGVVVTTLARAFPASRFVGLDLDERSINLARANAQAAGVSQRVEFRNQPADVMPRDHQWDFISTFDVIHDLPDPDAVLATIRDALAPGGTYLMVEPKVSDRLQDNQANPFARMLYGISCLHCVPQSLSQGGPGLGACWGKTRASERAARAGFTQFTQLDIRSPALAFYALRA